MSNRHVVDQIASLITEDPDVINEILGAGEFRKPGDPLWDPEPVMDPKTGMMMTQQQHAQWVKLRAAVKDASGMKPELVQEYNALVQSIKAKKIDPSKAIMYLSQKLKKMQPKLKTPDAPPAEEVPTTAKLVPGRMRTKRNPLMPESKNKKK